MKQAWEDPLAGIVALTDCACICDAVGEGEGCLVVANKTKKLLIYRGTTLHSEHKILAQPSCVGSFRMQSGKPPALAVAAGGAVYIYRNLRPYYRFAVPPVPLEPLELDTWERLAEGKITAIAAADALAQLRDSGANISPRSIDLLSFEDERKRDECVLLAVCRMRGRHVQCLPHKRFQHASGTLRKLLRYISNLPYASRRCARSTSPWMNPPPRAALSLPRKTAAS